MIELLRELEAEQDATCGVDSPVTIELSNDTTVTGWIASVGEDGLLSIYRRTNTLPDLYADIPRHYATSAIIGAHYTEGS